MTSTSSLTTTYALSVVALYGVYRIFKLMATPNPLANLRGPPSRSMLLGHYQDLGEVGETEVMYDLIEGWLEEYGPVLGWRDLGSVRSYRSSTVNSEPNDLQRPRFLTTDYKALSHIIMHTDIYHKPELVRVELVRLMGEGVLVTEGQRHRAQRKMMNPAFGHGPLRELTGIFLDKANEVISLLIGYHTVAHYIDTALS
jgi:cytochrome P450